MSDPSSNCARALCGIWSSLKTTAALLMIAVATTVAPAQADAEDDGNILGLPEQAVSNHGTLMICGGGTMPNVVYDKFVQLAGGSHAHIVLIPTAYPFESLQAAQIRYSGWRDLDVESVDFLDANSSSQADKDDFVEPLRKATGVWITGGEQGRLADIYAGTKVEKEIRGVLERGGIVGGTSAGAAIMSHLMIRDGLTEAVVGRGFDLLDRAVVDQHFIQRQRTQRLLGVLTKHPGMVGLGVDENTALVVRGNHLQVLGQSQVMVCLASGDDTPWMNHLDANEEADLVVVAKTEHGEPKSIRLSYRADDNLDSAE
jgi:cyanophycinase